MSQHLASLKIGDTILMKGPKGHVDYIGMLFCCSTSFVFDNILGYGNFTIAHKKDHKTKHKIKKLGTHLIVCLTLSE